MNTRKKNWMTLLGVLLAPILIYYSLVQGTSYTNSLGGQSGGSDSIISHLQKADIQNPLEGRLDFNRKSTPYILRPAKAK